MNTVFALSSTLIVLNGSQPMPPPPSRSPLDAVWHHMRTWVPAPDPRHSAAPAPTSLVAAPLPAPAPSSQANGNAPAPVPAAMHAPAAAPSAMVGARAAAPAAVVGDGAKYGVNDHADSMRRLIDQLRTDLESEAARADTEWQRAVLAEERTAAAVNRAEAAEKELVQLSHQYQSVLAERVAGEPWPPPGATCVELPVPHHLRARAWVYAIPTDEQGDYDASAAAPDCAGIGSLGRLLDSDSELEKYSS